MFSQSDSFKHDIQERINALKNNYAGENEINYFLEKLGMEFQSIFLLSSDSKPFEKKLTKVERILKSVDFDESKITQLEEVNKIVN